MIGGHDKLQIWKTNTESMTSWTNTGHTLPQNHWGADQVVRSDNYLYLLGGLTGSYLGNTVIMRAQIVTVNQ